MARQITANLTAEHDLCTTTTLPFTPTDNFAIGAMGYSSTAVNYLELARLGSGSAGVLLYILDGDLRVALFKGSGQEDIVGLATPALSTWFHALLERVSGTWQAYLNGSAAGSSFGNTPDTPSGGKYGLTVGANGTDYRACEAFAYDYTAGGALTADQRALLGAGYCPMRVRLQGLVHHWHLRGNESPEPDSIGTITGTPGGSSVLVAHPPVVIPQHWGGAYQRMGR